VSFIAVSVEQLIYLMVLALANWPGPFGHQVLAWPITL
jgi:hypothetical protein